MKSIIVALAMFPSLSALAHPETKAFDLDSFNGDYESNRIECGARLEFSRNLLILDNSINKPGMECDKGPVLLFTCDQETGNLPQQGQRLSSAHSFAKWGFHYQHGLGRPREVFTVFTLSNPKDAPSLSFRSGETTMKPIVAALALLVPFSSLAHESKDHFDLSSYGGDYEASGSYCGNNLEFSDNLLLVTRFSGAVKCGNAGNIALFDCDPGSGECQSREYPDIKIILLENGDFIIDNPYYENNRYVQFSKLK